MSDGFFKFEDCLLKHYVRTQGWLPLCRRRKKALKSAATKKARDRKLRYFTFCAVGAVDVLMLDVEKVLRPSAEGWFHTVCFFDRDEEYVIETQKRIPGAIGFPGSFTKIVLLNDPQEEQAVDELAPLEAPIADADTLETQQRQRDLAQRRKFIQQFPFDIINLDLEEFLFKPNDPLPGRVVNALRKIFAWQKRALFLPARHSQSTQLPLDGFSLMFTTQIGPPNLGEDYLGMLTQFLEQNIQQDGGLAEMLEQRTQCNTPVVLKERNFDRFFKLAMPKTLLKILMEEDWYVDPEFGIKLYEIERQSKEGPYKILHVVMDVKRQNPRRENRAPGTVPQEAQQAYQDVVRRIFSTDEILVSDAGIDQGSLRAHLEKVIARGRQYMGQVEE